MKRLLQLVFVVSLSLSYFISCKKDKGDAPVLPPYESMFIDFSNFTTQKKSAGMTTAVKGTESSTWEFASAVAGYWNSLITLNIEIPLASFESAKNYDPAYVSENLWQWSYDFVVGGVTYKAKLKGQTSTSTVTWNMYITNELSGGYTDFLWIEGTSKTDGSGGQWNFIQSPQSKVFIFQTDWTKSGDAVSSVKYTYVKNDANKESFINYIMTTGNLDASYNIHFSDGLYSDSDIEWNTTTRNGKLKCFDYLHNDNWYCWDSNKINVLCE
jgi:hypothetical protein